MMPGLLAAAICIVAFLVMQVAVFNLAPVGRRFDALTGMWLGLLPLYITVFALFQHRLPASWLAVSKLEIIVSGINGAVVYLLLFLIYLCFYFTDHSLTVAYTIELERRGQMTRDDIKQRFPHDAMLRQRLADLITNGYVIQEGEYYRLAHKGRAFAGTLGTMKRFLKLEPGG